MPNNLGYHRPALRLRPYPAAAVQEAIHRSWKTKSNLSVEFGSR